MKLSGFTITGTGKIKKIFALTKQKANLKLTTGFNQGFKVVIDLAKLIRYINGINSLGGKL